MIDSRYDLTMAQAIIWFVRQFKFEQTYNIRCKIFGLLFHPYVENGDGLGGKRIPCWLTRKS